MKNSQEALPPGSVIGILGGGQLGRMLAQSASALGFKCHIFAPEKDSPAFEVSAHHTCADYADETALTAFAKSVNVITYEFENVPVACVQFLEKLVPVRPGSKALGVAQDRILEKQLARELGAMTADFAGVESLEQLKTRIREVQTPGILKTRRFGYDGKGQASILKAEDAEAAWAAVKGQSSIYEGFVNFKAEMSVIAARGIDGSFAAYDVTENVHRNHILFTSTVPSTIDKALQEQAIDMAERILNRLEYIGVMGVEFFVGNGAVYVNEIAPRVHNSGHWTMDACKVSQFEQHIRAIAGWPLAATHRHLNVVMTNLLGDEIYDWPKFAAEPSTAIHIYGKAEARAGRKMGHINRLMPK